MSTKIFYIGASGYIGGPALAKILEHPKRKDFDITVLIRDFSKAPGFESLGLKPVKGSMSDFDLLERLSSESDIVFQMANADDLDATKAILKGLKKRFEIKKEPATLIHTSGTGVLVEDTKGNSKSEKVYDDTKVEDIESLADEQPHRVVDLEIVAADKEGYVKSYIVLPSTIWGIASNILTEKGLQNPRSQQVPLLVSTSVQRGVAALIGQGLNVWPHIYYDEVAQFYYILFDAIVSGKQPDHGRNGFYFLENGEYVQKDVVEAVAKQLHKLGKIKSDKPSNLSPEELEKFSFAWFAGTNSRCKSNHARSLGWKPVKTTEDFIRNLESEVTVLVS